MQVESVGLGQARIIKLDRHEDYRGSYTETWNAKWAETFYLDFVQDDISVSRCNVLRGLHGDKKTWKLVSCAYGKFQLVIVDMNPDSETFAQWRSFIMSEENANQVLIPPLFANGHLILSDEAVFSYKQTEYYDRDSQFTIYKGDGILNIDWAMYNPIMTPRDSRNALSVEQYCKSINRLDAFERVS